MSNTAPEPTIPGNDDQDHQEAAAEEPQPKGIVPDRASFQHLQALEDAIEFRTARLAQPCANCGAGGDGSRCDDHAVDGDLISAYTLARAQCTYDQTARRIR